MIICGVYELKRKIITLFITLVLLLTMASTAFADLAAYETSPSRYYVYAIGSSGTALRTGPGLNYDRIDKVLVPNNACLFILYESDGWGYTVYEGCEGWINLDRTSSEPVDEKKNTNKDDVQKKSELLERNVLLVVIIVLSAMCVSLILIIFINMRRKK